MRGAAGAVVLTMVLGTSLVSCGPAVPSPMSRSAITAIEDTLQQLTRVFEQGINALDVDRQFRLFSSDADLTWANDGQLVLLPRDSLQELYRGVYEGIRSIDFVWDTLRVSVLGPEAGVVTAGGHFAVTDTAGQIQHRLVVSTYVFVKRADRWQLVHGHASHQDAP